MSTFRLGACIVAAACLTGCASEVVRSPASFTPAAGATRAQIEVAEEATVQSSSGYTRVLPAGSLWELRGSIAQGMAYRRVNGIFTVEGAHVHEAFIVISSGRLVGFYLPVEQAYSPAVPVVLKLK